MSRPKKKKKSELPQPRHTWGINPKTRVQPSGKIYDRKKVGKKKPTWIDSVNWYGDQSF